MSSFIRVAAICLLATAALAQDPHANPHSGGPIIMQQGPDGTQAPLRGTGGEITEIKGDVITLKGLNGQTDTVKVSSATEYRKGREAAKLEELKVGDRIFVRGERDKDNVVQAQAVMIGGAMRIGGPGMNPDALGKEFIVGEIKAINETRLTILRPDNVTQEIEVDENTSFRNGRELITLPDFKVGDNIMGRGALKDGTFVAATLNKGGMMRRVAGPGAPADPAAPPATATEQKKEEKKEPK